MRPLIVLLAIITLGTAVIQHPNPVYMRTPSVVSVAGSPVPAGKSLVTGPEHHANQNVQQVAEARESVFSGQDVIPDQTPVASSSQSAQPGVTPQTFKILYFPNAGPLPNGQTATFPASVPYMPEQEVSTWDKYHLTDVVVGLASVAMVVGGGFLLVPRLMNIRARSLRELAENINTDDMARIARSVFKGIEKFNNLNAVNVE